MKAAHGLKLIRDVWSKDPIGLKVFDGENREGRVIYAQFDPDYDETGSRMTDAGKITRGNRIGSRADRRIAINLIDDYMSILKDSEYHSTESNREGHNPQTHEGIKAWHYFTNELYYVEQNGDEMIPFEMEIDIKEKENGAFVYTFGGRRIQTEGKKRLSFPQYKTAGSGAEKNAAKAQSTDILNDDAAQSNIQSGQTQKSLAEEEYIRAANSGDIKTDIASIPRLQ